MKKADVKGRKNQKTTETYIIYGTEYLSRRLREHRRRLGLALPYVAGVVGITKESLEQYEHGAKPMTKEDLAKLANLYQVSPSYFLGGISV